jgi:hypothetical protein
MLTPNNIAGCELSHVLANCADQEAKSGHFSLPPGLVSSQLKHTTGLEVGTDYGWCTWVASLLPEIRRDGFDRTRGDGIP